MSFGGGIDARNDPRGLDDTLDTRIDDRGVIEWVAAAVTNAVTLAGEPSDGSAPDNAADVLPEAAYVRLIRNCGEATVVPGVNMPEDDRARLFRSSGVSADNGWPVAAIHRILGSAPNGAVHEMRRARSTNRDSTPAAP